MEHHYIPDRFTLLADSVPIVNGIMSSVTRDFTATTFVVQEGRTLLLRHKKLGLWLPPGGHIDPNELPDDAARREVLEESGLEVELISDRNVFCSKISPMTISTSI